MQSSSRNKNFHSVRQRDLAGTVSSRTNKGELRRDWRNIAAMSNVDSARNSAFQQLYGFFVNTLVAASQNGFAVAAVRAIPGGDDAASPFHQRNQRSDIPAVEIGFDDDIDKTQRQAREQITIAAKAGHARGSPHPL